MIPLPKKLSKEMRQKLEELYRHLVDTLSEDEVSKMERRLPKLLENFRRHRGTWLGTLSEYASTLFRIYRAHNNGDVVLIEDLKNHISAALYYFVEYDDLIPDYQADGYLDDAYVINICLKRVQKYHPDLLDQFSQLNEPNDA